MDGLVKEYQLTKVAGIMHGGGNSPGFYIYCVKKRLGKKIPEDSIVLLHDGVRPFVAYDVISKNIKSVKEHGNAITCTPCYETILLSKNGENVDKVPYRKETYAAQAPQSFLS